MLDTSALAERAFSMLNDYLDSSRIWHPIVYIPKAVDSELSAWDKRPEKRGLMLSAFHEQSQLKALQSQGKLDLLHGVGREPKPVEIRLAQFTNTIDMIVIETSQANSCTLVTFDRNMSHEASRRGVFTLLFRQS